jgi:hypothetical protein
MTVNIKNLRICGRDALALSAGDAGLRDSAEAGAEPGFEGSVSNFMCDSPHINGKWMRAKVFQIDFCG